MKLLLLNNAGSGAAPGGSGSNTQVIFNDNGSLAGDSALTWNKTSDILTVTGDVNLSDGGTYTTTLQTITPTAARTISLPDATGTVALVAGSSGQLLYNNAGAYAGVSTMTFSGINVTLAGRLINSYTSVADGPAKVFTGTWFTGGTGTTTKPHLLIEPTGTTSTAWSTSGTGIGVNAASGFAGNLLDLQINGTSQAKITNSTLSLASGFPSGTVTFGDGNTYIKRTAGGNNIELRAGLGASFVNMQSSLLLDDAKDIAVGTTTGTKIGTATTQKLGFYNKTPVVQPTAVANATDAASVITQLNALLSRMRDLGLIAT